MNPYIKIIRPGNVFIALIAIILMAIIGRNFEIPTILALLSVFLVMSGGNVINDYFDYNIDKINRPDRPIPSGEISLKNARNFAYFLFIFAIFISLIISYLINNPIASIIVILSDILLYVYAAKLKGTILIGNFLVGFMTGLCFIFGGAIIGIYSNNPNLIMTSIYLGFFACVMTVAREITKDMEDIEGDKKEGIKTFPIEHGKKYASILASILIIIASILSPILYIFNIFNILYIIIMIIPLSLFIYSAVIIVKDQNQKTCQYVSKMLKIGILITFLSFIIGSLTI